MRTYVAHNGL